MLPPPSSPTNELEVRVLTPAEIKSVESVFADAGATLPDPQTSLFVGAVMDGEVQGFIVLQLKLHAEPMWIKNGKSELFLKLVAKAEETILAKSGPQWVYTFTPAGRISQLAQSMGMQLEPWCIYSKLVTPKIPSKSVGVLEIPELEMQPPPAPAESEEMIQ